MSDLQIRPYVCPLCVGGLTKSWDGRETIECLHCDGTGLTDDPCGEARRAPRPPGVMRTACADCALRRGSPELEESGARLPEDGPFWCHQGLPVSATGRYEPVAMYKGQPLGAMVCAGWWALKTGEPLPAAAYREIPVTEDDVTRRWGKAAETARLAHEALARGEHVHSAGAAGVTCLGGEAACTEPRSQHS